MVPGSGGRDPENCSQGVNQGAEQCTVPFIAANFFTGVKAKYVFKRGDAGLGYYLDVPETTLYVRMGVEFSLHEKVCWC